MKKCFSKLIMKKKVWTTIGIILTHLKITERIKINMTFVLRLGALRYIYIDGHLTNMHKAYHYIIPAIAYDCEMWKLTKLLEK